MEVFVTGKYKDFKEYMEDNYFDDIKNRLGSFIVKNKDSFENDDFYKITWIEQDEIEYTVSGVTFKDLGDDWIEIRTTVDADVHFQGYTRGGADSDYDTKHYNVSFKARIDEGLKDVKVTNVTEYSVADYNKDKSMSQSWLNYLYEDRMDEYAEDFLRRNYPKALLQYMAIDPLEVVDAMKLKMYYAPLGEKIFGKTYFGEETVTVYENNDFIHKKEVQITTTPGTILINPDVYFMRNIGTANNTIIHECVHWDRHKRAFELQSILEGGAKHISCEIVEGEYNGIGPNESALKWMEWQANQLAPRILMPAKTTKWLFNKYLAEEHTSNPHRRYAETLQETVGRVANYFQVSLLAAKLRLFELGFKEVEGVFVYCDGMMLPPYAFHKDVLDKNHSFVVDEENLLRALVTNNRLMELYCKGAIVYANSMLCFNDPKYITLNENSQYILTDYALEHADECCFIFKRKYSASDKYPDTYYRRCFLCREIDLEDFIPVEYDNNHKINQTKEEMQAEIDAIMNMVNEEVENVHKKMRSGFAGALDFFMTEKGVSEYQMSERTGISTVSISGYRNTDDPTMEKGTVLALIKGLCLLPHEAIYLLDAADIKLTNMTPSNIFVRLLITDHMDDTWEQWVEKLIMSGIARDWIPAKNNVVKEVKARNKEENEKSL